MESDSKYQMFNVIGKEFTFDVDVSKLPCGLNGALYFVEMAADGGMGKGNNKAGAKYGTGKLTEGLHSPFKLISPRLLRRPVPPRRQVDRRCCQLRRLGAKSG
jgi:hypothetical protein